MPITWQNVNTRGDAPALAASPLSQSGDSINRAFDIFSKVLGQKQNTDQANVQALQEAGKQAYLDKLAAAKTPEQLADLQSSGALDAARSGLGTQALAAVRGADEARLATLRASQTAGQAFADQQRDHAGQPLVDSAVAKATAGLIPESQAEVDAIADPHIKALAQAKVNDALSQQFRLHASKMEDELATKTQGFKLNAAANADKEGALRLTAAEQAAEDTKINRAAQESLGLFAADHKQKMEAARAGLESVTQGLTDLPRGFDGTVDLGSLTTKQIDTLNTRLKTKGLPPVESLIGADTRAAKEYDDSLAKLGVKPEVRLRMQPQIANALSSAPTAPIGADAAYLDRKNRSDAALDATNSMTYGSVATPDATKALTDTASQLVKQFTKPGSWREEAFNQKFSQLLATDGIMVDGVRVLPSPAQLQQIVMGAKNNYTSIFGGNGSELQDAWDKWKNDPDHIAGAAEAIKMQRRKIRQGINPTIPTDGLNQ